jgi:nitric oxide reductase NorD protein
MEELVGAWWHHAITRLADRLHPQAEVQLAEVQKSIGLLFRAAGGRSTLRLAGAAKQATGGRGNLLQRLAGLPARADTAWLEPDVLALPAALSVFEERTLNRDLYLWLALLAAHFEYSGDWVADNQHARRCALLQYPGFATRYARLLQAQLAQRRGLPTRGTAARLAEAAVLAALQGDAAAMRPIAPTEVAPVWIWLSADAAAGQAGARTAGSAAQTTPAATPGDSTRRKTKQTAHEQSRNAMVLPFRGEALMSWSEMVRLNRSTDDSEDGNAVKAANDMNQLSVAPDGQTLASRVRFDLDLPSASEDDTVLGPGLKLPEWDYRRHLLQPEHCLVQTLQARAAPPFVPSAALKLTARRVRRRLETLRAASGLLHGQDLGDDIDLDAWVRLNADAMGQGGLRSESPPVYLRRATTERSLCTLLLADLSLSTDAYATQERKIIEVIRDSLFVFGEALHAVGDPFAVWGFSSVRRQHVRMQSIKAFGEPWNELARARVGAVRPGFYTRMGAAIRHATLQLGARPERKRLLLLLTDGKPNDLDQYEGRYGLEDTRHAVHEAKAAGLSPFCVTIDEKAHDYLPLLFGHDGYALVRKPQELAGRLTQTWATMAK